METRNETTRTILSLPDITCGGCAASIKNALGTLEGVRQIEVDVAGKSVAIEHDKAVSRERIAEKLDDIGFPVG